MVDTEIQATEGTTEEVLSFPQIIMKQVHLITKLGSVDLIGGFITKQSRQKGDIIVNEELYIANTRDAFCNAIDVLNSIAEHKYSSARFDNNNTKKELEFAKKMEDFYKNWHNELLENFNRAAKEPYNKQLQNNWNRLKIISYRELFSMLCGFLKVGRLNTGAV